MKKDAGKSISEFSMLELFQSEMETQSGVLTSGLLAAEKNPHDAQALESIMRAAHSLKGAARLVGVRAVEQIAHVLEDVFVAAQRGELLIASGAIDVALHAVDTLRRIAAAPVDDAGNAHDVTVLDTVAALEAVGRGEAPPPLPASPPVAEERSGMLFPEKIVAADDSERVVRVGADRLNRILGLCSELVVDARHAQHHQQMLLQLKKKHDELVQTLETLREYSIELRLDERMKSYLAQARKRAADVKRSLLSRHGEADEFERRLSTATARLHREVILTRMRPFADGVSGFQRMARDLARITGKRVELKFSGLRTDVDRDVLEKLEAPLTHLIRNAIDHGIEPPQERVAHGKPEHGTVHIAASYSGGMLYIVLEDDGRGVDFEKLKRTIVERRLTTAGMVDHLTQEELVEFLFLPRFSTRAEVTELSGRGVGLDVVRDAVQAMGGAIRTTITPGRGTRFALQLPITLSLIPALLVEVAGESYAFPLPRIDRLLMLDAQDVQHVEGHQYAVIDGENIGLVYAGGIINTTAKIESRERIAVVVLSDRLSRYGVVVDRIAGERVLAVQALDPRLGKVRDISAAALLDDGTLTLIVDVDDFVRSIDNATKGGTLQRVAAPAEQKKAGAGKRILVVDDSITVRGVEAKLLESRGYSVATAVDGMDGWNQVRGEKFALVITDIDMPRMDGVELVHMIKNDPQLRELPVMIVSYKDRPEDRKRGLDAGADYYLTKGSFHDETLVDAVVDLIGRSIE